METIRKLIAGKKYNEHGPIYCPAGTSWDDLRSFIRFRRVAGNSVRVIKKPIKPSDVKGMMGNTHEVWYYIRAWS